MKETTYRSYLLGVLLVILAFNFVDRFALGLLLQEIKADLDLSDTQLGLLSGIAFALFYSTMGIPIARLADRGNRVTIITITTGLWGAAVALCGLATSFLQLLLVRVAVGVGEAGCIPPAHSLIADYFNRAERPRAVSRYMLGVPLSFAIGYFLAGWLNELYGWRVTFALLGVPGVALAALARLTLKEPRLNRSNGDFTSQSSRSSLSQAGDELQRESPPSMKSVCTTLWGITTFRHLLFAFAVVNFFGAGILQWQPTFFIRSYGLQTGELGTWFAVIYGAGGLLGTYWGGEWASRQAPDNERLQLKAVAIAFCGFCVCSIFLYLVPNHFIAFGFMALATIGVYATNGPLFATLQTLVPERMRAISIAVVYLFANLIGLGLGPLTTGILSDALRPLFGEESLRYALLILCPGYLWAAWFVWKGSKTVSADLESQILKISRRIQQTIAPVYSGN